jgi:hypothetical protein
LHPQLPTEVTPILNLYLNEVETHLPGLLNGFYLHGSIALGAFHPKFSDVDFVAVLNRRVSVEAFAKLEAIHRRIEKEYPRPQLQGSYLQPEDLGRDESVIPAHPHYSDGVLHTSHHAENDVTWWLLKNRGVTLQGIPANELDFSVDWSRLLANMRVNLNRYWGRYTREPIRIIQLLFDEGIQWAVLGVLRQYYSFETGEITSKIGAGSYALQHLPPRWHRIIQEAINIRNQQKPSRYRSRLVRAIDAFAFMRFIIGWCNTRYTTAPATDTD